MASHWLSSSTVPTCLPWWTLLRPTVGQGVLDRGTRHSSCLGFSERNELFPGAEQEVAGGTFCISSSLARSPRIRALWEYGGGHG